MINIEMNINLRLVSTSNNRLLYLLLKLLLDKVNYTCLVECKLKRNTEIH